MQLKKLEFQRGLIFLKTFKNIYVYLKQTNIHKGVVTSYNFYAECEKGQYSK